MIRSRFLNVSKFSIGVLQHDKRRQLWTCGQRCAHLGLCDSRPSVSAVVCASVALRDDWQHFLTVVARLLLFYSRTNVDEEQVARYDLLAMPSFGPPEQLHVFKGCSTAPAKQTRLY